MPAGKGRYTVGKKGSYGCNGYPVVGGEGKVHGCHPTRSAAFNQQSAIYASENQASKSDMYASLAKAMELVEGSSIEKGDQEMGEETMKSVEENSFEKSNGCENCDENCSCNAEETIKSLNDVFAKNLPTMATRTKSTGNGEAPFTLNLK